MASNFAAFPDSELTFLKLLSNDHLECVICHSRFVEPKVLDCLHSFCLRCLQELRDSQDWSTGAKFQCPICRQETALKGKTVATLRNNFALSALVKDVTKYEQQLQFIGWKCNRHSVQDLSSYCNICKQVVCAPQPSAQPIPEAVVHIPVQSQLKPVKSQLEPVQSQLKPVKSSQLKPVQSSQLKPVQSQLKPVQTQLEPVHSSNLCPQWQWVLAKEITTFYQQGTTFRLDFDSAWDIAAFTNDEIIVADHGNDELIAVKNKRRNTFTSEEMEIDCDDPIRVSINSNDRLIVLESEGSLKIFDIDNRLLNQYRPEDRTGSTPTCIAVGDRNRIAVGYHEASEISLHNPDGSHIKTLCAPHIDNFLAFQGVHLIYTNHFARNLTAINCYSGCRVFYVDLTPYMRRGSMPNGVCCDTDGTIYVAVRNKSTTDGQIYQFSSDGQYMGCAIQGCGCPFGITLTDGGDLAVAAKDCVMIYRRV